MPPPHTRILVLLVALTLAPTVGHGQALRDRLGHLFIFGPGDDPLFLAGSASANNPATIRAHGTHFVPAAVTQNGAIIGFLTEALGTAVANVPVSATSSGETFHFEGGVPVKTSSSAGPIFAERAQTLGRGRLLTGVERSQFHFTTLRGVPLDAIDLIFTHENVDFDGCDAQFSADCAQMGVPTLENDIMLFRLSLDLDVSVTAVYATYGINDRLDFGVILPLVGTHLSGFSDAQLVPFGGPTAAHFFAGTPEAPQLGATREESGNAFGVGDMQVRAKYLVHQSEKGASVALLGDLRFPTGDPDDLLGAGAFAARGLLVLSAVKGNFSPHANVGYAYRAGDALSDAVIAIAGFDQLMGKGVTLAADVLSDFQVGRSSLKLPQTVHFDVPFRRDVQPTTIPDIRDNLVNGSFGFKFLPRDDVTLIANLLTPLNRGGVRSRATLTFGAEYTF